MNWVIVSWVFVAILTAINVFVFIKLKGASEQMMKMAFPNAKNMNEAMGQMQGMMGGMGGLGGMANMGGNKGPAKGGAGKAGLPPNLEAMMGQMNNPNMQAQMKAAMDMLAKMQKNQKR
jgi:nitrate/nitrite transporter NarK